ncbi:alginate lyase family protein [Shewanella sp. WXL01]|uniref:heparinase II/III domain-containing protein n=1 Tax=Shewanella sp. WXL01 TaxID=2709721 RepID=UPI0014382AB0|nr:heparinase II/III family protein [Shewanella sp. WXL01]NKF51943.1 alginate lyase family protein [Shewanella sp. WXL01]
MSQAIKAVLFEESEVASIAKELGTDSLMGKSLAKLIADTDAFIALGIDVPGHSEAGGYAHNRHKQNYQYINQAGRLFLVTGQEKYAKYAGDLLLAYADKYLKLDFHKQLNTNPPGRLFHQILNEHVFLLNISLGYSCIRHYLSAEQQQTIVDGLFQPMLDMFTEKYDFDFDRIHNHGIWAVAAVAICGLAIDKPEYVEMSIHGLKGDDIEGGFLAQISKLFAPSGYYMEGPYYHRYAIRPLCLFAEAIHRHRPELDIFNFNGQVIGKTIKAMLATAYPNGVFPALNDASLTMDICDAGVIVALGLYAKHYGIDDDILGMAKIQDTVWVNGCGQALSEAYASNNAELNPCWPSVELNEGPNGDRGAQAFIRMQSDNGDVNQLVMNYGQHGMGHGHFDTLGISFFNNGQEVLREYGFGRWVNVEPKFGGRYLDENKSYARQTIAHNAVAVDQKCQNNFDVKLADSRHGEPHFFSGDDANVQGVSAFCRDFYEGVDQQRSLLLIKHEAFAKPILVDLFRLISDEQHQYDYAVQYAGQIVRTNFDYQTHKELDTLGDNFGYQHLWNVAQGKVANESNTSLVSWLQGNSYYTWLSASSSDDEIIFTRSGANDPSFNLRSEPGMVLRRHAKDTLFASVLETHGYFNEAIEASTEARGQVTAVNVIGTNEQGSVIEVVTAETTLTVMVSNQVGVTADTENSVTFNNQTFQWQGYFAVEARG